LNREASYVAASRARQNTEIVTSQSAREKMLENAGKEPGKTTALDIGGNLSVDRIRPRDRTEARVQEQRQERSGPELSM
jgi:hypothetical protein